MTEHDERQLAIIRQRTDAYRKKELSIHSLVKDTAALAAELEDRVLGDGLDGLAFEIELINSDIIDKKRAESASDRTAVEAILEEMERLHLPGEKVGR